MRVYVIQNENGIMINVDVSVKNQMIEILVKMITCGILVRVTTSVIRYIKLTNIQILKIVRAKKRLIGKLVLACKDEISNTTETSSDDKKVTYEKNNCLNHTILLIIICLILLVVISINCYYYYTRD